MKKTKKRRVRWGRILVIVILIVALIGGGLFAWNRYQYKKEQEARHEYLAQILEIRQDFTDKINAVQNTGDLDEEAFEALVTFAREDNADAYASLSGYSDADVEIDDTLYAKLQKLDPKTDGYEWYDILVDENLPDDYKVFVSRDDDRLAFVQQYANQDQYQNPPAELSESLESIPHLLQWDLRWGYMPYGTSNMVFAGCAPTSISMVFSYLLQDPSITPYAVAQFSEDNGYFVDGVGTAHALLSAAADYYGVNVEGVYLDADSVNEALDAGKILIVTVNPGTFTRVGHFMVIAGRQGDQLEIIDPNSIKNTSQLWDEDLVLSEAAAIWAYS